MPVFRSSTIFPITFPDFILSNASFISLRCKISSSGITFPAAQSSNAAFTSCFVPVSLDLMIRSFFEIGLRGMLRHVLVESGKEVQSHLLRIPNTDRRYLPSEACVLFRRARVIFVRSFQHQA